MNLGIFGFWAMIWLERFIKKISCSTASTECGCHIFYIFICAAALIISSESTSHFRILSSTMRWVDCNAKWIHLSNTTRLNLKIADWIAYYEKDWEILSEFVDRRRHEFESLLVNLMYGSSFSLFSIPFDNTTIRGGSLN